MPLYNYEISTSGGSPTNVESLTTPLPAPKSTFHAYSQMIPLGDGTVRGSGWATAEWRWGVLSQAQRDQLRTIITGASTTVKVRTRTMDSTDSYKYYQGVAIWPIESEEREAGRRLDLVIRFQKLVEYTP